MLRFALPVCLLSIVTPFSAFRSEDRVHLESEVRSLDSSTSSFLFEEELLEVRSATARACARADTPGEAPRHLLRMLEERFGRRLSVESADPTYTWYLDPVTGEWLILCRESTTFTLRLESPVVVELTVVQRLE